MIKFTYEKVVPGISHSDDGGVVHNFNLEGSHKMFPFKIVATKRGVYLSGTTQEFQPEEGEVHMPVDDFREFMARLSMAFDLAWKEQEQVRKETLARRSLLEVPHG